MLEGRVGEFKEGVGGRLGGGGAPVFFGGRSGAT
jgi:hypothetical protein